MIIVVRQRGDSAIDLDSGSTSADSISHIALSGSLAANDSAFFAFTTDRIEGPRLGGHTFTVLASRTDAGRFVTDLELPPGSVIESHVEILGTVTEVFHDGGTLGPVFTTCTYPESVAGVRVAE